MIAAFCKDAATMARNNGSCLVLLAAAVGCGGGNGPPPAASALSEFAHQPPEQPFVFLGSKRAALGAIVGAKGAVKPSGRCASQFPLSYRSEVDKDVTPEKPLLLTRFTTKPALAGKLGPLYQAIATKLGYSESDQYEITLNVVERRLASPIAGRENTFRYCCTIDPNNCPGTGVVIEQGMVEVREVEWKKHTGPLSGGKKYAVQDGVTYRRTKPSTRKERLYYARPRPLWPSDPLRPEDVTVNGPTHFSVRSGEPGELGTLRIQLNQIRKHTKWTLWTDEGPIRFVVVDPSTPRTPGRKQPPTRMVSGKCRSAGPSAEPNCSSEVRLHLAKRVEQGREVTLRLQLTDEFGATAPASSYPVLLYTQGDDKANTLAVVPNRTTLSFAVSRSPQEVELSMVASPFRSDRGSFNVTAYPPPGVVVESGVGTCRRSPCALSFALDDGHESVWPKMQQIVVAVGRSDVPGYVVPVTIGVQLPTPPPAERRESSDMPSPWAPPAVYER